MPDIKLIGLDLMVHCLPPQRNLPIIQKKVLTQALDAGIEVLVATGRPFSGIPKELQKLPGIHYALTSNEPEVLDIRTEKVIIEQLLPLESAIKALRIFEKYDTLCEIYSMVRDMQKKKNYPRSAVTTTIHICGTISALPANLYLTCGN